MANKFGTFKGVFVPSVEAILGTVLFIIMPGLTADIGLLYMLPVVLIAHSVTLATAFSIADCATNLTKVEGGGMYALAKRSLGTAFGGSIGIFLYLAQAVSVGFYCFAFSLAMLDLLKAAGGEQWLPWLFAMSPRMQMGVIGSAVYFASFVVVMIGADFTLKIQTFILVVLGAGILAAFAIPLLPGVEGGEPLFTMTPNWSGSRPGGVSPLLLVVSFTLFFPAVTGISTGVGMSGDLKDPRRSIVRGTFSAIIVTLGVYLAVMVLFAFLNPAEVVSGYSGGVEKGSPVGLKLYELAGLYRPFPGNMVAFIILSGVFFATGSSALSLFMTGPRTLQYLAIDGILPRKLHFFARDFRRGGSEPRFAVLGTAVLGYGMIWLKDINTASMVVGNLFLLVYGWVNGAAFLERISRNPTFRPTSRNHWTVSLYGFLACLVAILLFDWKTGLLLVALMFGAFWLLLRFRTHGRVEGVWWGVTFSMMTNWLSRLKKMALDSRNWRPVVSAFAFCDDEGAWKHCAGLAGDIASFKGLVNLNLLKIPKRFEASVNIESISLPASIVESSDPRLTVSAILQSSNLTGVQTNTVLLEYAEKVEMMKIIRSVMDSGRHLLMLKNGVQLPFVSPIEQEIEATRAELEGAQKGKARMLKRRLRHLRKRERQEGYAGRLDIWWRGQRNGNLMVLLAYIINRSRREQGRKPYRIRVIRSLMRGESVDEASTELNRLLQSARLNGDVMIYPYENRPFIETLEHHSSDAALIMMGLPGNFTEDEGRRIFDFNEYFFTRELNNYSGMPAILFVKSAGEINLLED